MKTRAVYFSATYTTRKVVEYVAQRLSDEVTLYDITNDAETTEIIVPQDELLIVGIPVYAGRVPAMAVERIKRFKGEGTRAVALAIYGNRDYDDALLELSDLLSENNFLVISAGAFIAQHSIFPKVGANRPDAEDYKLMDEFADETLTILGKENRKLLPIHIPREPSIQDSRLHPHLSFRYKDLQRVWTLCQIMPCRCHPGQSSQTSRRNQMHQMWKVHRGLPHPKPSFQRLEVHARLHEVQQGFQGPQGARHVLCQV